MLKANIRIVKYIINIWRIINLTKKQYKLNRDFINV